MNYSCWERAKICHPFSNLGRSWLFWVHVGKSIECCRILIITTLVSFTSFVTLLTSWWKSWLKTKHERNNLPDKEECIALRVTITGFRKRSEKWKAVTATLTALKSNTASKAHSANCCVYECAAKCLCVFLSWRSTHQIYSFVWQNLIFQPF